jgi:ubiquinone biosynthesis protein COQ4
MWNFTFRRSNHIFVDTTTTMTVFRCRTTATLVCRSIKVASRDKRLLLTCRAVSSSSNDVPFYGLPRPASDEGPSLLKRLGVALHSATTAFSDPTRADAVAALGEVTGHVALTNMYDRMMSDATGQDILRDRPIVSKANLPIDDFLRQASDDDAPMTFGKAYGVFLKGHGFDPDERDEVKHISNPELAYIMLRYRQCHDYWHVLTGLPPTVLGELGLKWLELLQTGLPVAALSATVGSLRLTPEERKVLTNHYLPWAVRMSQQSAYLMNVYYEKEFDTDLEELRRKLRIEPAPVL